MGQGINSTYNDQKQKDTKVVPTEQTSGACAVTIVHFFFFLKIAGRKGRRSKGAAGFPDNLPDCLQFSQRWPSPPAISLVSCGLTLQLPPAYNEALLQNKIL